MIEDIIKIEDVILIAKNAGGIIMRYYGNSPKVTIKKDSTPVTQADFAADKYIRSELERLFPRHKILSEETESNLTDFSGYVWMVDPLDGTSTFALNRKEFSSIIGLCKDGIPILGVVYAPAMGKLWYAEKGKGAFMDDGSGIKRLKVSTKDNFSDSKAIIKPGLTKLDNLPIYNFKQESGAAIKIMQIANGEVELHIDGTYKASKWDVCGTSMILTEAGGRLTDLSGRPIDYFSRSSKLKDSFMVSNSLIHDEAVREIRKYL